MTYWWVISVFVRPECRRRGVACALFAVLCACHRELTEAGVAPAAALLGSVGMLAGTAAVRAMFTGAPYILQAITLTPNNVVGLSSPQIGAIAR